MMLQWRNVVHGSKLDSQRITQNGVTINTFLAGGYGGAAAPNPSAVQELTIDYFRRVGRTPNGRRSDQSDSEGRGQHVQGRGVWQLCE